MGRCRLTFQRYGCASAFCLTTESLIGVGLPRPSLDIPSFRRHVTPRRRSSIVVEGNHSIHCWCVLHHPCTVPPAMCVIGVIVVGPPDSAQGILRAMDSLVNLMARYITKRRFLLSMNARAKILLHDNDGTTRQCVLPQLCKSLVLKQLVLLQVTQHFCWRWCRLRRK